MARVISVVNQKGGTGKTTTAVSVSAYLAHLGHKTLIVDMEPQANATIYMGIDPVTLDFSMFDVLLKNSARLQDIIMSTDVRNLHLAPAQVTLARTDINLAESTDKRHRLKDRLSGLRSRYDYIFIDCPPSLSLLPVNALVASDEVIIPLQPRYLSLEGLKQLYDSISRIKKELNPSLHILGILFTMSDMRFRMTKHCMDLVRKHFGDNVFTTVVHMSEELNEAPIAGQSIFEYAPMSRGAEDYKNVTEEILERGTKLYRRGVLPRFTFSDT